MTMKKHHLSHEMFLNVFTKDNTRYKRPAFGLTAQESSMETDEHPSFSTPPSLIAYESLEYCIESRLKELEASAMQIDTRGDGPSGFHWSPYGRLGTQRVVFDISTNVGSLNIDFSRLSLSSHSGFSSIKANVGVYKGKWMYEVMLGTKGVMQVGWATSRCRFSQEKGVGDTPDSYAYDGNRVRKWNLNTYKYGDTWHPGDVVGITIDLEEGSVGFYRNGKHLGQAFNNVKIGHGMVYFPAVSLAYNEALVANFGATPLRYPMEGFQPLEAVPYYDMYRANLMFGWLFNLVVYESKFEGSSSNYSNSHELSRSVSAYLVANLILEKLSPLVTNKYIIEACLLKKLLCLQNNQEIHVLLDIFWALLEKQQIQECLEYLVAAIINGYRYSNSNICETTDGQRAAVSSMAAYNSHVPFDRDQAIDDEFSCSSSPVNFCQQKQYLLLLLSLVQHPRTRSFLLKNILFDKVRFPQLLEIRPVLDNDVLEKRIFPNLTVYSVMRSDGFHSLKSKEVEHCLSELESLHHMIMDTLIFQDEVCRIVFIEKFDAFIKENCNHFNPVRLGVSGISGSQQLSPLPVILSFFHRLTSLIRIQYENMINTLPISFFVDSACISTDITRVGGLVNYLSKTYEREITHYVETASSMNPLLKHVYILIDGLIKLYSVGAHKQLGKHCSVRDTLSAFSSALEELDELDDDDAETGAAVQSSTAVLEKELLCRARQLAWINSTIFTPSKKADLHWLLKLLLNTLDHASSSGCLFGFIPDYYIESCLNLSHAIRFYFNPNPNSNPHPSGGAGLERMVVEVESSKEHEELLKQFATFIAHHFSDERIANSDLRDNIAQALATLVSNPDTLQALESIEPSSRRKMITSLTAPYENRAWAQSNWILLRLWKGNGFAYRYTIPPNMVTKVGNPHSNKDLLSTLNYLKPCPSTVFQNELRDYLSSNARSADAFISSLLSQLNWSFSEFIGMLQEIQNAANRPEKVFIDSRQLKICCTCFDLTLALLRVIEMVITLNPLLILKAQGNDLQLNQLCTMLNQILNRVTVPTGCFEFITDLDIPGLELVAHFPILTAVAGILVALVGKSPQEARETFVTAFISDASFLPSSVLYLCDKTARNSSHKSTCVTDSEEVSEEEAVWLQEAVKYIVSRHDALENSKSSEEIPDDEICTICYANRKTALFVPCGHKSCKSCISMHFLRHQECFFCKAILDRVVFTDSAEVLYPKK